MRSSCLTADTALLGTAAAFGVVRSDAFSAACGGDVGEPGSAFSSAIVGECGSKERRDDRRSGRMRRFRSEVEQQLYPLVPRSLGSGECQSPT